MNERDLTRYHSTLPQPTGRVYREQIDFNDVEFRFSHMKAPRGFGSWAFSTTRNANHDQIWWFTGCTFANARRMARERAERELNRHLVAGGHVTLYVLP